MRPMKPTANMSKEMQQDGRAPALHAGTKDAMNGSVSSSIEARADTAMASQAPCSYPRRVLLAVTGLSPQVVTESLYALAVQ